MIMKMKVGVYMALFKIGGGFPVREMYICYAELDIC